MNTVNTVTVKYKDRREVIKVGQLGIQGPKGDTGDVGPAGPASATRTVALDPGSSVTLTTHNVMYTALPDRSPGGRILGVLSNYHATGIAYFVCGDGATVLNGEPIYPGRTVYIENYGGIVTVSGDTDGIVLGRREI
jgi:hypothetical protein